MNPHRSLFSQHPLAQLAVAFSIGIGAADYLGLRFPLVSGAVCSILVLIFVIKKKVFVAGLLLLAALFFAGAALAVLERRTERTSDVERFLEDNAGTSVKLVGVLDGPPEFARDRLYLSLRVERISESNAWGRVWLLAPFRSGTSDRDYRALQLRYGARIQVVTALDRTGNYRNPGVSTLSEYLDRRDFDATGIVRSPASIVRLDDARVFPPLALLYEWRERLQREIDSRFAPETAGVLDAALLGNRYNLSRDASERFREGGTFHVLVISGLHISFIGGIVFLAVRRLTRRRLLQFLFPATVVWAYSLAVGAEASVVRAALMFTFTGLAAIIFRQASSLNALGGAALVLLVWSPKELFDPSFQLTFLSVLAIVVIAWPLLLKFSEIGRVAPNEHDTLPTGVFTWPQVFLRTVVLERAELEKGTRSLVTSLSTVQDAVGRMAGTLAFAARFTLRVWSDCGLCKRPVSALAADDLLLSPLVIGVAGPEHRCEHPPRCSGCRCSARSAHCAG